MSSTVSTENAETEKLLEIFQQFDEMYEELVKSRIPPVVDTARKIAQLFRQSENLKVVQMPRGERPSEADATAFRQHIRRLMQEVGTLQELASKYAPHLSEKLKKMYEDLFEIIFARSGTYETLSKSRKQLRLRQYARKKSSRKTSRKRAKKSARRATKKSCRK
jgi:hypothetical protein